MPDEKTRPALTPAALADPPELAADRPRSNRAAGEPFA